MNSVLHLKGQFDHQDNQMRPGPKNLPKNTEVKVEHLEELAEQLEKILDKWKKDTRIGGALVSVHYCDVVAKSNRISALLAYKSFKSNDSIRGSKFDTSSGKHKHVFTHFVALTIIEDSIKKLRSCIYILKAQYHDVITYEDIARINDKIVDFRYGEIIPKTSFIQAIIDSHFVERFDVDQCLLEKINEPRIVTLYGTGIKTIDLLRKLGISVIGADVEFLNETTVRLTSDNLQKLYDTAPYLIAMQVKDMAEIPPVSPTEIDEEDYYPTIAKPTNEPIVGVIDTPFCQQVYFKDWVTYIPRIDQNIEINESDMRHGTAVSSIIVDGPTLNPELDDGCGNFRVRHFGVATGGRFSSFTVLKEIRKIVSENTDIKVWNLSLGSLLEIEENFISPEAAELDRIQSEYDIVFVVSGTNKPNDWTGGNMKIGAPADSLNSLVVNSVDFNNKAASYHRVGPVLSFFHKPDVSYYGGDKGKGIHVCLPNGDGFLTGTSFAAPWISRKMAYLIQTMGLSREVAKALIIDSAANWNRRDDATHSIGYGVVPVRIDSIIKSPNDEIRFIMTGSTDSFETYTYRIPVPLSNDKYPYFARATLAYFPDSSRDQGVDYTDTEMDIHFGRVRENNKGKIEIAPINKNRQGDDARLVLYEGTARDLYRKWDNIKHISEEVKKGAHPRIKYGSGTWGLSIKTKERLKSTRDKSMSFGVVVTLKEMNGVNRIDDFVKQCIFHGWIVNRIDIDNRVEVYNKAEENITFE